MIRIYAPRIRLAEMLCYIEMLKVLHCGFELELLKVLHIKKFAEIWSSCTALFTISCVVSIVLTLCTHISFRSKDEFQIRNYHEKEQLLANRMVPNEAQYTKTPLVIFTVKEDNHLQYISNGHFDNSNRFIHIS